MGSWLVSVGVVLGVVGEVGLGGMHCSFLLDQTVVLL